jgi:hypothetical protein
VAGLHDGQECATAIQYIKQAVLLLGLLFSQNSIELLTHHSVGELFFAYFSVHGLPSSN